MDDDSTRIPQEEVTTTPTGNKGKRKTRNSEAGGGSSTAENRHSKTPRMTGGETSAAEAGSASSASAITATSADAADFMDIEGSNCPRTPSVEGEEGSSVTPSDRENNGSGGSVAASEAVVDTPQRREISPPPAPRCLPALEEPSTPGTASRKGSPRVDDGSGGRNGGSAVETGVLQAKSLTSEDFSCRICLEMLARPVTLACGHTACEACIAEYLELGHQRRAEHVLCPAGCQRRIPPTLPEVSVNDHNLLGKVFPLEYRERLNGEEGKRGMVTQVRRRAEVRASSSRRGVDGGGGAGFGRRHDNADPFRGVAAVAQDGIPPTLARWYKRIGLCLIFFLFLSPSWLHDRTAPGDDVEQHLRGDGYDNDGVGGWCSVHEEGAFVWGVMEWEDGAEEERCVSGLVEGADDEDDQRLLSSEMNVEEFLELNRWEGLRSLYPWNSPWSSTLYLFISDPILVTGDDHPEDWSFAAVSTSDHRATAPGGQAKPRRLFLELYGPIVGIFVALGFSTWLSELLTVLAINMCPILAAVPLLHVTTVGAFPPDMVLYVFLQLVVATLAFWRLTWRLYRARGGAIVLVAGTRHLIREVILIKVMFPLMEHVLFRFILDGWTGRYAIACAVMSFWIGAMKLLLLAQMVLLMLPLFLVPPETVHNMEVLWCNLVTHLLLGNRFYRAFSTGPVNNLNGGELGQDLWRALKKLVSAAMAAEGAAQRAVAAP